VEEMSSVAKQEVRYQYWLRMFKETRVGGVVSNIYSNYFKYYTWKAWYATKRVIWIASTGAIIVLLPLTLESLIESEATAQYLSSQLGESTSNVQYRPY
jgi:hypothetical protein